MNKTISVSDLKNDQKIEYVPFALKELDKKVSRQEKPYFNVLLGDKTGEMRGKVWTENMVNVDNSAKVGDIVAISGLVQEYAGKPQIIIESIEKVVGVAPEEFLSVTKRDRDAMNEELTKAIEDTKNPYIKKLLTNFWEDQNWHDRYFNHPAAEYVHHGYIGGMMEHVWEMWNLAQPYIKLYPQVDRDVILAGIIFHDLGKLEELDIVGATIVRTRSGKLVAHIGQGLILVSAFIDKVDDFPEDLREKILHIVLSHHGEVEKGSPVVPQTLEAMIVHFVDINGQDMRLAIGQMEIDLANGDDFTDYNKYLKRSLYQADYLK